MIHLVNHRELGSRYPESNPDLKGLFCVSVSRANSQNNPTQVE